MPASPSCDHAKTIANVHEPLRFVQTNVSERFNTTQNAQKDLSLLLVSACELCVILSEPLHFSIDISMWESRDKLSKKQEPYSQHFFFYKAYEWSPIN
jgi:hypothetical protein